MGGGGGEVDGSGDLVQLDDEGESVHGVAYLIGGAI